MFIPIIYSERDCIAPASPGEDDSVGVSPPAFPKRKIAFKGIFLRSKPFSAFKTIGKGTKKYRNKIPKTAKK